MKNYADRGGCRPSSCPLAVLAMFLDKRLP